MQTIDTLLEKALKHLYNSQVVKWGRLFCSRKQSIKNVLSIHKPLQMAKRFFLSKDRND